LRGWKLRDLVETIRLAVHRAARRLIRAVLWAIGE
jgi:hypothetical protein